jgi:hypothetical protein
MATIELGCRCVEIGSGHFEATWVFVTAYRWHRAIAVGVPRVSV